MIDLSDRIPLPQGCQIQSGSRIYQIEQYISAGSNAMVYQAGCQDTLMPEHIHTVLMKELYPMDPLGRISRDASMGPSFRRRRRRCLNPTARAFCWAIRRT